MIPPALIAQVNRIRTTFQHGLATLEQASSFQSLLKGSDFLRAAWREIRDIVDRPRFRRPCDGRIVCAFVGASSHGKTTILDELFPDLARRGWLITESNDTTSQSLRIEYAATASSEAAQITVHSWGVPQIKKLADAAQEKNLAMGITTDYEPDAVILDGSAAKLDPAARKALKFPLRHELRPFPQPYEVSAAEAANAKFIRALTIKDLSDRVEPGPVLSINGSSYNSLQLRAVVKDVTLHESFERIIALSGSQQLQPPPVRSLVFIDTPGLGTVGSVKDEVLIHVLAEKSPQIVLQLLEEDELDIVLHMVLCGGQSTFGTLWEAIEKERGRLEIESLVAERLFVVLNGTNKLFQDPTLSRKWDALTAEKEGDPFSITLRDNILEKMVPKGRVRPAGICLVDSIQYIGHGDAGQYRTFYEQQKQTLLAALRPGGVSHETLKQLGLDQTFAENVEALCDPADRGQGFLIRQIVRLVEQKGPVIFLKRFLIRTELRQLRELLSRYYDDHGVVRREAVQETLQQCLSFLDAPAKANMEHQGAGSDFTGIETFASAHIDTMIDKLPMGEPTGATAAADSPPQRRFPARPQRGGPESRGDDTWVGQSFRQMCAALEQEIISKAGVDEATAGGFVTYFRARTEDWGRQWGYDSARLPNPLAGAQKTDRLIRHCLKFHCREILYQLLVGSETADHASLQQSAEEKEKLASLIRALDEAIHLGERLCREHAIGVSL